MSRFLPSFNFVVLLVLVEFAFVAKGDGVFDKIKAGFRYANDYLQIVRDVTNLVAKSLHREQPKKGENEDDKNFGTSNVVSAFFRLLGLDSAKVAAITINSFIFLAQMISSLFELKPGTQKVGENSGDTETSWDPLTFILTNKNENVQSLIQEARDEDLSNKLTEMIDASEATCARLLICKISVVIKAAQKSLQSTNKLAGIHPLIAWLPSRDEFETNSDECEEKHAHCPLFPDT